MKQLIKSFIPDSIKQSLVGDVYRFLRGREKPSGGSTAHSESVSVSSSVYSDIVENSATEDEGSEMEEFEVDVRPRHLHAWNDEGKGFQIVDIREPFELQQGHLSNSIFIPMNDVPNEYSYLNTRKPIVLVCAAGMRSWSVAQYLRNQGLDNVWSLENGWSAWSEHGYVSPFCGRYAVGTKVAVSAAFVETANQKPTTQYGYIHNCTRDEEGVIVYDVQFWTEDGVEIVQGIPEGEVQPFVPKL
jgi:rhodanese-related sulfurtransferase